MGGGKTQTSTQAVSIPPEVLARYNSVNAQAQTAASQPFQQYSTDPNAFVAPLTATQQAGIANTNTAAGQAQPYFGAATQQLMGAQQGATPFIYGASQGTQGALQQGAAGTAAAYQPLAAGQQQAQDAQGQAYGQYMGAQQGAQPYNQAATTAALAGAAGAAPYYGQAAQNVSGAQDVGTALAQQSLGTLGQATAAAAPLQGLAAQSIGSAYPGAQGYNQTAADFYGMGLGAAQPLQNQAARGIQRAYAGAQPFNQIAAGMTAAGSQGVDPSQINADAINQYMSPYLQSVVGQTAALQNQQNQQAMSGQTGNAIRQGAFGGDRAGIAAANLQGQQQLATGNLLSGLLNQGYGQALSTAQQQQGVNLGAQQANLARQLQGGQQLAALGQQGYSQGMGAAQQQAALGQQLFGQGLGAGQAIQGLGQQQYGQQLGAGQALAALGQQFYGQGAQTAGQQAALGQQLSGLGLSAAQQQQALGQGIFGIGTGLGSALQGIGQQQYAQGAGTGQNLASLGQQAFGQGATTAQQQAALAQQMYGMGTGSAAQQAALGNQLYGMGAGTSQALAGLGAGAQGASLQGAQAQLAAGQAQQQTQQAGQTALYNQFLQQQSYPFQVAQFLANIAEGTGALSGSTTTTQQPGGFFSDERLKENIEPIGETFDGQKVYSYNYKGEKHKQIGLIAQDVEKKHPDAVGSHSGYKTVDYGKATQAAADRGHFYRGGLVPSSEGGAVTPAHLGEGFAGGGPALPNATDMAALLAAQAQMFGPFSQGGLYGGEQGGLPGGGSGRVPAASLPVGHLAVAGELPKQTSALEQAGQIADIADKAKNGVDWVKNQNWFKSGEGTPDQSVTEFENKDNPAVPLALGGVAGGRDHYDDGGMPYSQQTGPGLTIPDEQKEAPKLMTASNAPGQSQSGLGQVAGIAKDIGSIVSLASMFSDKRLKENIKKIGKTYDGQNIYSYNYKGDPRQQIGLLAQDVEKHHPHAVGLAHGYKTVDYDKATEHAANRGHFYSGGVAGGRRGYANVGFVDPDSIPVPDNQIGMIGDEDINNPWAKAARHADNAAKNQPPTNQSPANISPTYDSDGYPVSSGDPNDTYNKQSWWSATAKPFISKEWNALKQNITDESSKADYNKPRNLGDIPNNIPVLMPQPGPVRIRPAQTGLVVPDAKSFIGPNQPNQLPDPAIVGPTDTAGLAGASPTSSAPAPGLAAAPAPAPAAPVAADTKDEKQPDFLDRIAPKGGFLDRMTETRNLIPLLSGIAAMGTAPTRSFGVALASGLGAGAKSYLGTQEKLADIGQTKALTRGEQITATTNDVALAQKLITQEAMGLIKRDPRGPISDAFGNRYSPTNASPSAPSYTGGNYQYITPSIASALNVGKKNYIVNSGAGGSFNQDAIRQSNALADQIDRNAAESADNVINSRTQASALFSPERKGPLQQGALAPILSRPIALWNSSVGAANKDLIISGLGDTQIADKIAMGRALAMASASGERALGALEGIRSAVPTSGMDPDAAATLVASSMAADAKAMDEGNVINEARRQSPGGNFMMQSVHSAFRNDENYSPQKYNEMKGAIKSVLLNPNFHKLSMELDDPQTHSRAVNTINAIGEAHGVKNLSRAFTGRVE
jgi:hypothetical protein